MLGSLDGCSLRVFLQTQCSHRQAQVQRVFHQDSGFLLLLEEDHAMASVRAVGSRVPSDPALCPVTLLSCCMK